MSYGRREIGDAFAAYARDALSFERCREVAEREGGFSPALWRELAGGGWLELGSPQLALPFGEIAAVAEAAGAQRIPAPLAQTAAFVLPLLSGRFDDLAVAVAEGSAIVAVAMPQLDVRDGGLAIDTAPPDGEGRVSGVHRGVAFAQAATHLLVPVADDGLSLVPLPAPGVTIEAETPLDLMAPTASVQLDRAAVDATCTVGDDLPAAVVRYLHAETADAVGGIGAVLAMTCAYVSEREQFGVPVGSFQALKHALVNVQIDLELARGLLFELADAIDEGPLDAAVDVLAARTFAADAFTRACETAIQCHGGAGFTWEHGLHHWYRAALRLRATPYPIADLRRVAASLVSGALGIEAAVAAATR